METSKHHWDNIYSTKKSNEVSWTQELPKTSLEFLHSFDLAKDSSIIDVGGGESKLVDFLLAEEFTDITVLDISEEAINHCKERLGRERAARVKWIVTDITEFTPSRKYYVWHDRATFHFLTTEDKISKYVTLAANCIDQKGFMAIGTFSESGPAKCSGLYVRQYSEETLSAVLKANFQKMKYIKEDHETPLHALQNFLFCSFRRAS